MNRFLEGEIGNKKLPPIGAYWQHSLVPLEQALEPVMDRINGLDRSIKEAKKHCCHSSKHQLTKDESAAVFLYTMEGGDNSFYRILNEALRSENRRALRSWFGFLKLFDTALAKLPTVKRSVWRGISGDISKQFKKGDILTWWSISSCSMELEVVQDFLGSNTNATLLMIETRNAKDITGYTSFPDEKEILLGPGTELRVESNALHHGALHIVHLIELYDGGEESMAAAMSSMEVSSKSKSTGTLTSTPQPVSTSTPTAVKYKTTGASSEAPQDTKKTSKEKHYVCQYSGCNNRCDGNCYYGGYGYGYGYYGCDGYGYGDGYYDYGYDGYTKCEKCGRGYTYYKCSKCGHAYCYDCCFK